MTYAKFFIRVLGALSAAFFIVPSADAAKSASASKPATKAVASPAATSVTPKNEPSFAEKALVALVPAEKAYAAAGFFGPVTKKYLPKFQAFSTEFETSTNRLALIARYLPVAEKALAEARVMRVPPKYEAEKANYLRFFDAALISAKTLLRLKGYGSASAP